MSILKNRYICPKNKSTIITLEKSNNVYSDVIELYTETIIKYQMENETCYKEIDLKDKNFS